MNAPGTKMDKFNIVFLGSGNVATHLSIALTKAGHIVKQVFSRNEENAKFLANKIQSSWINNIESIIPDADIYIFALKDDALPSIIEKLPVKKSLWLHTAGSVPVDIFKGYAESYGVIYPLQTLSKEQDIDFSKIPLFIEGNNLSSENQIRHIAEGLSKQVFIMPSEKRKYLHLAAVFACNFTNHMYALAAQLLEKNELDWRVLLPLIDETTEKLHRIAPVDAQTGPAVRYDQSIIKKHLSLLKEPDTKKIYELISNSIHAHASLKEKQL